MQEEESGVTEYAKREGENSSPRTRALTRTPRSPHSRVFNCSPDAALQSPRRIVWFYDCECIGKPVSCLSGEESEAISPLGPHRDCLRIQEYSGGSPGTPQAASLPRFLRLIERQATFAAALPGRGALG